jgi:hypothetical protein
MPSLPLIQEALDAVKRLEEAGFPATAEALREVNESIDRSSHDVLNQDVEEKAAP